MNVAKRDNRKNNVERLQEMKENTKHNIEAAEETLQNDDLPADEKQKIREKNELRHRIKLSSVRVPSYSLYFIIIFPMKSYVFPHLQQMYENCSFFLRNIP